MKNFDIKVINFTNLISFSEKDQIKEKAYYLDKFNEFRNKNFEEHKQIYLLILKQIALSILDKNWHNHLQELNNIRMSVSLSGYGGKDPVNEFRMASFSAFNNLIYEIQKQLVLVLNNLKVKNNDKTTETNSLEEIDNKKIGRNDPCPCGSGKKFKQCHGLN